MHLPRSLYHQAGFAHLFRTCHETHTFRWLRLSVSTFRYHHRRTGGVTTGTTVRRHSMAPRHFGSEDDALSEQLLEVDVDEPLDDLFAEEFSEVRQSAVVVVL